MILTSIDSDRSVDSRVVVGLLLSMLIVAGCNSESRTTSSSSQSNTEVTELISNIYERIQHQDRRERHIYEEEVERIHTIGLEDESKLFKPGQIVFADSDLIVFDYGDFLLKRYSVSGQKVTTYGNGFGNGPGEFYNPIDAAVGQNHSLHVLDSRQSRVTVFDKTGQYISTVSINSAPPTLFRFAHNANSTRYHFLTFSSKYSLFGYENGLIFPYSDFTNNSGLQTSILLNGNIKSTPNGFVYVAAHLPIIIIFDMSGEIVHLCGPCSQYFCQHILCAIVVLVLVCVIRLHGRCILQSSD